MNRLRLTNLEKSSCQKLSKKFFSKQKLHHQVVKAEVVEAKAMRVEVEAIQKLPLKVRLDWTRSNAKQREAKVGDLRQPSRVVDYVTREGWQHSRVVANLRDRSLHMLILITYFLNVFNEQKALSTILLKR